MISRFWTLSLMTTICLSSVPAARAVSGCTNDLLNGGFALQYSGTVSVTAGKLIGGLAAPKDAPTSGGVSVNAIARFNLTPDGVVSGYSWGNIQGAWVQDTTLMGSYTVNTDCTLDLSLWDASGATAHLEGVIVGQGASVLMTQTDAGIGITGTMKHVHGFCQTGDLTGTFGIQYTGSTLGSSGSAISSTGMVSLDGNGGANAMEDRINAGKYAETDSSGSLTVNPDCSFSLRLTAADGSTANFAGLITFDANQNPQPILIRSDANTAVSGSMVAQ
jgi:hypothetical protein